MASSSSKMVMILLFLMILPFIISNDNIDKISLKNSNISMDTTSNIKLSGISLYEKQFNELSLNEQMTITPLFTPDFALEYMAGWLSKANNTIEIENQYFSKFNSSEWESDEHPIVKELVAAALRGVTVRVIINEASDESNQVAPYLINNGVEVKYMKVPDTTHNKFVAIDDKVVFISSINYSENSFVNNRESGIVIQNVNVTNYFLIIFEEDWTTSQVPSLPIEQYQPTTTDNSALDSKESIDFSSLSTAELIPENYTGTYNVTLFAGPDTADETIFRYLDTAQTSLWVEMYTFSKQSFVDKLIELKTRGVDVKVLLSQRRVSSFENEDTHEMAEQLFEVGIPVFNSTTDYTFTHAKFWIIDGVSTFIYSGNWSPRSVPDERESDDWPEGDVNREFGVSVNNAEVTDYYEDVFSSDWSRGIPWSSAVSDLKIIGLSNGSIVDKETTITIASEGFTDTQLKMDDNEWINISTTTVNLFPNFWLDNGIHSLTIRALKNDIIHEFSLRLNFVEVKSDWKVLISEINFDPEGDDAQREYIELVNAYDFDILLDNWIIKEDDTEFVFPEDSVFEKYTTTIIARDKGGFGTFFGKIADYEMSMSFTNTGDEVSLFDNNNILLDAVAYGSGIIEGANNPIALTNFDSGESLQRLPIDQDTDDITADFVFADADPKNIVNFGEDTSGFLQFYSLLGISIVLIVKKKKDNK